MLRLGAVDKDLDVPLYRSNYSVISVICRIHCFMDRAPSLIHIPTHPSIHPPTHPPTQTAIHPSNRRSIHLSIHSQVFPCEMPRQALSEESVLWEYLLALLALDRQYTLAKSFIDLSPTSIPSFTYAMKWCCRSCLLRSRA